jgi:hypothetical protein
MQSLKRLLLLVGLSLGSYCYGQHTSTTADVDIKSYSLYEKGAWKELIEYGKGAIATGTDFQLLRLRIAYAAFMLNNFSEAVNQYNAVLKSDSYNATARYYLWLSYTFLNQQNLADLQVKYLSREVIDAEKLKAVSFTGLGFEAGYKFTDLAERGNSTYARLDAVHRLGFGVNMHHAVGMYNQEISEPLFTSVRNNRNIAMNQREYYNNTTVSLNNRWQITGAYHYIHTPFNNFTFNNHVGLLGLSYFGGYYRVQINAIKATLTDSSRQQFDLKLGLFPRGNLDLYFYSTAMYSQNNTSQFNFKQVAGFKVLPKTWLEMNATFGKFRNLLENDGLYVYNAIDPNTFKGGASVYYTISAGLVANAVYTFEQRQVYSRTRNFNQHSIIGGLIWKL